MDTLLRLLAQRQTNRFSAPLPSSWGVFHDRIAYRFPDAQGGKHDLELYCSDGILKLQVKSACLKPRTTAGSPCYFVSLATHFQRGGKTHWANTYRTADADSFTFLVLADKSADSHIHMWDIPVAEMCNRGCVARPGEAVPRRQHLCLFTCASAATDGWTSEFHTAYLEDIALRAIRCTKNYLGDNSLMELGA